MYIIEPHPHPQSFIADLHPLSPYNLPKPALKGAQIQRHTAPPTSAIFARPPRKIPRLGEVLLAMEAPPRVLHHISLAATAGRGRETRRRRRAAARAWRFGAAAVGREREVTGVQHGEHG